MIKSVTIIGGGNVATHLCIALAGKVDELISIPSRELEDLPLDSDIYIIAVSDKAIAEVATAMPSLSGVVAHTAGSVGMDVLSSRFKRAGVFYPLQTFTKGSDLDYSEIPVFVEGTDSSVEAGLSELASLFTNHCMKADSARREKLHIASVFACNFANHLWDVADKLLREDGLTLEVLMPLIGATVEKLKHLTPHDAQTGPAVRKDMNVINRHLEKLADSKYSEIYRLLSKAIIENTNECD